MPPEEQRLNRLLRQVDWRFLLRQQEAPRILDLTEGKLSEALSMIGKDASGSEPADLVVLGFPTPGGSRSAREALRAGGEVACAWKRPRPGAVRRARRALEGAGFADVRFYRPGPGPGEAELWLPLDAPAVAASALAARPPRSRQDAIRRRVWRTLAPVYAIARAPGKELDDDGGSDLPNPDAWVLLTGGAESDAKVVGLPFADDGTAPAQVVKFARTDKAGAALEREAGFLRDLEREHADLTGVPRLRGSGQRAGRAAIAQDAVRGKELNAMMSPGGFASFAPKVTHWLIALAGSPTPRPATTWEERLVFAPIEELERDFSDLIPADFGERARRALSGFGDLPLVWEHRDFGPWNVVLEENGEPAAIDWEDAEPQGLPGLDLAYFLASAAFAIDGVPGGAQRVERALESNRRLLDPGTELGRVATACVEEYRAQLDIADEDFRRLRLLCWIVQSLIACHRLRGTTAGAVPAAADADLFLHLAKDELQALEGER